MEKKYCNEIRRDIATAEGEARVITLLVRKGAKYDSEKKTVNVAFASSLGKKSQGAIDFLRQCGVNIVGELKYRLGNDEYYLLNTIFYEGRMPIDVYRVKRAEIGEFNKSLVG